MDPLKEKVFSNGHTIPTIDFQPIIPTSPAFEVGATIKNKHTGKYKTIEHIETVGAAHTVYITTDGVHYNTKTLRTHWILVNPPEG